MTTSGPHESAGLPDEALGRLVRGVWVRWAKEQPGPKPSWLVPWDDLDEGQREVDIRIGRAVAKAAALFERELCAQLAEQYNAMYAKACLFENCRNATHYVHFAALLREPARPAVVKGGGRVSADCNCTCQIAGAHDPDCATWGPPQEPPALPPRTCTCEHPLSAAHDEYCPALDDR